MDWLWGRTKRAFRATVLASTILLGACAAHGDRGNAAQPAIGRVTAATFRSAYPRPDDWHRLALYGDWDFVDIQTWRAIVTQPDCDRATALAIFWKASPEYFVEFPDRAAVPAINRADYDLVTLIRDRWKAGAYTRAELEFDPDTDAWPMDRDELERRYGDRVEQLIPSDMRVQLHGRRLDRYGFSAPGVLG
jgi:hypothetical protein